MTQDYRKSYILINYSFHFRLSYQYRKSFLRKFAEMGFATSLVVEAFRKQNVKAFEFSISLFTGLSGHSLKMACN